MYAMNPEVLKRKLKQALSDRTRYPGERFTLRSVIERAAAIAAATVDELAVAPAPAVPRQQPVPGESGPHNRRRLAANEKRGRLLEALRQAGAPLRMGEIGRKAMLTTGECSYLLNTTPGVAGLGDGRYALTPAAAGGAEATI